ncbi:YrzI family small protein [Bacillus salitolerans]|uniref:YrzI family small protein n=1 Tax=Bacillus salitolerans TaxID=1437434 RepID=A0ABW4LNJ9_9BACI
MTINILFFSISIQKRKFSNDEVKREQTVQNITNKIRDRKCEMHRFM